MKNIAIADVRNFVLLGHTGSGKTTLVDALLYKLGINDRLGSVDDGSSMADWTEEEKARKISTSAKPFDASYKDPAGKTTRMVFMDTPGYADFYGQVVAATLVADAALVAVDVNSGIQVGTARVWRRCEDLKLPRGVVITGIDKENANFANALAAIQETWGARCVPVVIPVGSDQVVDVLASKPVPAEVAEQVSAVKGSLVEVAAETDDAMIEKYLSGGELSPEEIAAGLRGAVASCRLIPVFVTAAKKAVGLVELLDGIKRLFPTPADRPAKDQEGKEVDPAASAPALGLVWRSVNDPFVGQLTFVRVYGGTIRAENELFNVSKGEKERVGALYLSRGKKQETITEVSAGDIVAIAKLKHTALNDTVGAPGTTRKLPVIVFPNPVMSYAVVAKTQGDEDKLGTGLHRICEDDPTLKVERTTDTHELILSGLGDVHLDVAVKRLKERSNAEVTLQTPKVPYKETVTGRGEGHYKHKKQSGGRGQYGDVYLRVEHRDPSDEEWFANAIVGGAIPGNFIPAIEKGLVEAMLKGAVAGYPVTNVKVTVYDGSYHDVDSSEIAFKIASRMAFRDGMSKAKPVLLEPIMKLKVMVPDQYMGDVTGDLNHKRGRILGMGSEDGMQVITAEVPQAEFFQYCPQLRSMTGGRGSFEMEFSRYDVVPANIAQKVIAAAEKHKEEEE
ncbi:MAG: elongation factor G [Kiritimatiellia bacterium]